MEYRMKCDVCGNIFCYTDEDLKKNEDNAKMARINALGGVFSAMGGTPMQTHHMTGQANLHSSKIVDYTQCPHCHSRSISVYTGDDTEKVSPSVAVAAKSINTSASAESLLKRAFIFLEDEEWETADAYCEACLDKDPELAEAYLGKLMAELHVKTKTGLKDLARPFDDNANYKKTVRFGNDELKNTLCKYLELIHNRNEAARKDDILHQAKSKMTGNTISQYQEAIPLLASIAGWKDADKQEEICHQKLAELRKQAEEARVERERLAELERQRAAQAALESQERKQKNKKILIKYGPIVAVVLVIILLLVTVVIPGLKYSEADKLVKAGQYDEAIKAYRAIDDSKKTDARIDAANYAHAEALLTEKEYVKAAEKFRNAGDYKDSTTRIKETYYAYAEDLLAEKEYEKAARQFKNAGDYKDSTTRIKATYYAYAEDLLAEKEYVRAADQFENAGDYEDAVERQKEAFFAYGEDLLAEGKYFEAVRQFEQLGNYNGAKEKAAKIKKEFGSGLTVTLKAFNTSEYSSHIDSSISRSSDYLHYVFEVHGSDTDRTYTLRSRAQWPGKEAKLADWVWENVKVGDTKSCAWKNGYSTKNSGTLVIEILVDQTEEVIGRFEMKVS